MAANRWTRAQEHHASVMIQCGFSLPKIAKALNRSETAVSNRIAKGLRLSLGGFDRPKTGPTAQQQSSIKRLCKRRGFPSIDFFPRDQRAAKKIIECLKAPVPKDGATKKKKMVVKSGARSHHQAQILFDHGVSSTSMSFKDAKAAIEGLPATPRQVKYIESIEESAGNENDDVQWTRKEAHDFISANKNAQKNAGL